MNAKTSFGAIVAKHIQKKCNVTIIKIKHHPSGWIDILYNLPYCLENSTKSHENIKKNIKAAFREKVNKCKYNKVRVRNTALKQKRRSKSKTNSINDIVATAMIIQQQEAILADTIGYMPRFSVKASLPKSHPIRLTEENGTLIKQEIIDYSAVNGNYEIHLTSSDKIGLPYGVKIRLILAWITREAVIKKEREIHLGRSLSSFMKKLGYKVSGGPRGTIKPFSDQMHRLFTTEFTVNHDGKISTFTVFDNYDPANLFIGTVTLSENFYNEITEKPVPVDIRAINAFKRSSFEIDIYCWLTFRVSHLKRITRPIPWQSLATQFGSNYSKLNDFIKTFKQELKIVKIIFNPGTIISPVGLQLKPSTTHIRRNTPKK